MPFDPLLRAVETPFRETFYPLGKAVVVESNDRGVLDSARSRFGHWPARESSEKPLRLRLLRDSGLTGGPPWPKPVHRAAEDLYTISCAGNVAVADLKKKYAVGFFTPAFLADTEFFRSTFLTALVYWTLGHHYFTPVHASCVVREGRALCLCGEAGAGKTSLAYFCGRRGWTVMAEDAVYLSRDGELRLRGDPCYFHFTVEASLLFPDLVQWPASLIRGGEECRVVRSQDLGLTTLFEDCLAGPVVFLNRGGRPRLDRVPPREAFHLLYDGLALDDPATMKAHQRTLRRLVHGGAYRLGYSKLEEALEGLSQI